MINGYVFYRKLMFDREGDTSVDKQKTTKTIIVLIGKAVLKLQ